MEDGAKRNPSFKGLPSGSLEIRFRVWNATFTYRRRSYCIGSMLGNRVMIFEADRPVVEGSMTWSGIRFGALEPEFRGIERELAVGLALRD